MEEYWVVEYTTAYGINLCKARRFNEDEKENYADWYKDYGFVRTSKQIELINTGWQDLDAMGIRNEKPDGEFIGYYNEAYIISEIQKDQLLAVDKEKGAAKKAAEINKEIEECRKIIDGCEQQGELYTTEEARKKAKIYNDANNEGMEGYVPHYYTQSEYDYAVKRLSELEASM